MFDSLFPGILVHAGAMFYLICFAFRNQILLRSFAIIGDLFYTAYYFSASDKPLWEAIIWNIPNIALNLVMIYWILRDNKLPLMNDDELMLFRTLKGLTPAQFKKVLKGTSWQKPLQSVTLTEENSKPDNLYFVLHGDVSMQKAGNSRPIPGNTFIGEIAFLNGIPATARVDVKNGPVIATWRHDFLNKIFEKDDKLKAAFTAMMASDLASKLSER